MGNTLGCLALVLAAAAPPQAKPEINYHFQMVEVRGLSWRDPGQTPLQSVAHHGAVSVWTAPGDFLEGLPKETLGAITADAKVVGLSQTPAHLTTRKEQAFVTRVSWKGKGDGKTARPITENVREGVTATVIGRKLDQGVLVQLVIDDTDIRSVHTIDVPSPNKVARAKVDAHEGATCSVSVTASMDTECCSDADDSETSQTGWLPSKSAAIIAGAKRDAQTARAGFTGSTSTGSQIQLPEIGRASAAGEWLIPDDGVLVIGFGPHTVADADGRAVVREHLAVITAEAEEGTEAPTTTLAPPPPPVPSTDDAATAPAPVVPPAPRTAAAIPDLPSRTLPQGLNSDGTHATLPPLPDEAQADKPADESQSDEPLPSPQRKREQTPPVEPQDAKPLPLPKLPVPAALKSTIKKAVDQNVGKTSFSFPQLSQFRASSLFPLPLPGAQFMLPLKAFALKLPFNQKLEFELVGRIVPDLDAAVTEQVVAVGN